MQRTRSAACRKRNFPILATNLRLEEWTLNWLFYTSFRFHLTHNRRFLHKLDINSFRITMIQSKNIRVLHQSGKISHSIPHYFARYSIASNPPWQCPCRIFKTTKILDAWIRKIRIILKSFSSRLENFILHENANSTRRSGSVAVWRDWLGVELNLLLEYVLVFFMFPPLLVLWR
jgi:hypothetical protein